MFPKNKQNNLRQKKNKIKEKCIQIIQPYQNMLSVFLFFYFSSDKPAKHA